MFRTKFIQLLNALSFKYHIMYSAVSGTFDLDMILFETLAIFPIHCSCFPKFLFLRFDVGSILSALLLLLYGIPPSCSQLFTLSTLYSFHMQLSHQYFSNIWRRRSSDFLQTKTAQQNLRSQRCPQKKRGRSEQLRFQNFPWTLRIAGNNTQNQDSTSPSVLCSQRLKRLRKLVKYTVQGTTSLRYNRMELMPPCVGETIVSTRIDPAIDMFLEPVS